MIFPRSNKEKDRKGHDGVVLKCMDLNKYGGGDFGNNNAYNEGDYRDLIRRRKRGRIYLCKVL